MDRNHQILEQAVACLPDQLRADLPQTDTSADGVVEVRAGEQPHAFAAHVKPNLTKSRASVLLTRLPDDAPAPLLVVSDRITASVGALLREHGISYMDTDGNCFLHDGELFVLVEGRQRTGRAQQPIRAFQEAGLKLIFFLLLDPDLASETYRDLADRAGISRGAVGYVMSDLGELGYVLEIGRGRRRLQQREELIEKWTAAYAETLRPKLARRRFRFRDAEQRREWQAAVPLPAGSLWGGEPAADVLTGYLRPELYTLYTQSTTRELVQRTQLIPDEEGGVEVLDAFWKPEALTPYRPDYLPIVPPLLVYADLIASGHSRNVETARLIYEDQLQTRQ